MQVNNNHCMNDDDDEDDGGLLNTAVSVDLTFAPVIFTLHFTHAMYVVKDLGLTVKVRVTIWFWVRR